MLEFTKKSSVLLVTFLAISSAVQATPPDKDSFSLELAPLTLLATTALSEGARNQITAGNHYNLYVDHFGERVGYKDVEIQSVHGDRVTFNDMDLSLLDILYVQKIPEKAIL